MFIPAWLWIVVEVIVTLAIFVATLVVVGWLQDRWKGSKLELPHSTAFWVAVAAAAAPILVASSFTREIYVIESPTEYATFVVVGAGMYERSKGEPVRVTQGGNPLVINETDQPLLVREVIYVPYHGVGSNNAYPEQITIGPRATKEVPSAIEYFLDEEPPESVTTDSHGNESAWWLTVAPR